jgi:hypothetical protein
MGFLMVVVGLAVITSSVVGLVVRAHARRSRLTRETNAWVQFLREDLSWLVATAEVVHAPRYR